MEVAKEKNRARHAWLYQAEEEFEKVFLGAGVPSVEVGGPRARAQCLASSLTLPFPCVIQRQKDNLTLPPAEHQAIESSQAGVETWKYKAKNSLMYYPEGKRWCGQ